jgi:hypothetical protein
LRRFGEKRGVGILDKLLGRRKKAAGDLMDKPELRQEGADKEAGLASRSGARDRGNRRRHQRRQPANRGTQHPV